MFQFVPLLVVVLVVLGSSIWVLIDAQKLGLKREQAGLLSNSPVGWFVGCIGVWIVAFPLYLVARSRAIAQRTQGAPNASVGETAEFASRSAVVSVPHQAGGPTWVGPTALALGIASIPAAIFGVLGAPLWLTGLALGIWGAIAGGSGRKLAIGGIAASVVGFLAMIAAIILMAMWLQGQRA
ncbi:MAG: hypothetical protein ACOYN0_07475 [Phycisphaerales bacterium]